ncbi:hypothetical protein OIH33_12465, partial [Lactococcus petauri]
DGAGGGGGWPFGAAGTGTLVSTGGSIVSGGLTAATAANSTTNGSGGNGVVRNKTYASGTKFVRADVGDGGDGGSSYAQS